ncbi:MAG: hypothetical protein JWP44_450, partial [Mucilaginibacter sp.]|nr:hypothetical protein [Mucilaginibacter sp.]
KFIKIGLKQGRCYFKNINLRHSITGREFNYLMAKFIKK